MAVFREFGQRQNADAIFDEIAPFLRCGCAANGALLGIAFGHRSRLMRKAITDIIGDGENFFTHFPDHRTPFALLLTEQKGRRRNGGSSVDGARTGLSFSGRSTGKSGPLIPPRSFRATCGAMIVFSTLGD